MRPGERTYRFRFSPPLFMELAGETYGRQAADQYVRAHDETEALRRATELARTNWPARTRIVLQQVMEV